MPRDAAGAYTNVSGIPVVTRTAASSTVMNNELADLANEMTDSLSRSGKGGMTNPLKLPDGSVGGPAVAFNSEPTSGWFRAGAGDLALARLGAIIARLSSAGHVWTSSVIDNVNSVAHIFDTVNAMSNAATRLWSFRVAGVEKAAIKADGTVSSGGTVEANFINAVTNTSVRVRGAIADGASAVGVILDNAFSFANAAAKLVSIRNGGVEKAYFDKDGRLNLPDPVGAQDAATKNYVDGITGTITAGSNWSVSLASLVKQGNVVTGVFRAETTSAAASFASCATLPAGFRPANDIQSLVGLVFDASTSKTYLALFQITASTGVIGVASYCSGGAEMIALFADDTGDVARLNFSFPIV